MNFILKNINFVFYTNDNAFQIISTFLSKKIFICSFYSKMANGIVLLQTFVSLIWICIYANIYFQLAFTRYLFYSAFLFYFISKLLLNGFFFFAFSFSFILMLIICFLQQEEKTKIVLFELKISLLQGIYKSYNL